MGWLNINGNWIGRHSGKSWSSYWKTRFPSDLVLTVNSSTQITIGWTNNGVVDYDGVLIKRSTNGVTYTDLHLGLPGISSYIDETCEPGILYYYDISYFRHSLSSEPLSGAAYEDEVKQYRTGLANPLDAAQLLKINTLVQDIKIGLSCTTLKTYLDQLILLAGATSESSLRNLVENANHATLINTPAFTAFEGFRTNGIDNAIRMNMITGLNCVQNSAYYGLYFRDKRNSAGMLSGNADTWFYTGNNSEFSRCRCHADGWGKISLTFAQGYKSTARNTSTNHMHYINGSGSNAYLASGVPTTDKWLGAYNDDSGGTFFHINQFSVYVAGKYLTTAQDTIIRNAIEKYMDSNGKGVIA